MVSEEANRCVWVQAELGFMGSTSGRPGLGSPRPPCGLHLSSGKGNKQLLKSLPPRLGSSNRWAINSPQPPPRSQTLSTSGRTLRGQGRRPSIPARWRCPRSAACWQRWVRLGGTQPRQRLQGRRELGEEADAGRASSWEPPVLGFTPPRPRTPAPHLARTLSVALQRNWLDVAAMGEVLDGRPAPAPSLHFEGLSPSLPRKDFFTRPNVALPAHSLAPTAPCHLSGWGLPPGSGILGSSDRVCKQIQKRGGLPRPSGKGWDTLGDWAHSEPSSKTLSRRD